MRKPRLLFVDDETNILDDLEEIFGYVGKYEFFRATSGKEALKELQNHQIDLVITDIKMPDMDGLELAGIIRKSHRGVKIMFITAVQELIGRAVNFDPIDVVEKPIRRDVLLHKVERHFKNTSLIKLVTIAGGVLASLNIIAMAFTKIIKDSSLPFKIMGGIAVAFLIYFIYIGFKLRKS